MVNNHGDRKSPRDDPPSRRSKTTAWRLDVFFVGTNAIHEGF